MTIRKGKSIIAGNGAAAIANENRVGLVKPDNETIQIDQEGTISAIIPEVEIPEINTDLFATKEDIANMATKDEIPEVITSYNDLTDKPEIPAPYELPIASTDILGGVKVDGDTIKIVNGIISAASSGGDTWTYSKAIPGYIKHSSGIIFQWATLTCGQTGSAGAVSYTITFPTPFSTSNYMAIGEFASSYSGLSVTTKNTTNVVLSYVGLGSYYELLFVGY